jgi:GST-like protein
MLKLFYFPSPNCLKALLMLEECEIEYELQPVDILSGAQFSPEYLKLNPNNKVPALYDDETQLGLFESGAILEYLAEKSGRFLPQEHYWTIKSWLHWQAAGLGPMAGQAHHFRKFSPEPVPYAITRYTDEMNRLYGVLDKRLKGRDYIAGPVSIADFACWPWIRHYEWQGQSLEDFPEIARWFDVMSNRDGVRRAMAIHEDVTAPKETYKHLYGQTAETPKKYERSEENDGE